jgi:hypothetical protein
MGRGLRYGRYLRIGWRVVEVVFELGVLEAGLGVRGWELGVESLGMWLGVWSLVSLMTDVITSLLCL